MTADEAKAVLDTLVGHSLHLIASLALATGMRRGELLALQWCDIDLDRAKLRVERSVEETRRGLRVKPPKTKRGRRHIALPPETVAMLRDHRKKQNRASAGPPPMAIANTTTEMDVLHNVRRSGAFFE